MKSIIGRVTWSKVVNVSMTPYYNSNYRSWDRGDLLSLLDLKTLINKTREKEIIFNVLSVLFLWHFEYIKTSAILIPPLFFIHVFGEKKVNNMGRSVKIYIKKWNKKKLTWIWVVSIVLFYVMAHHTRFRHLLWILTTRASSVYQFYMAQPDFLHRRHDSLIKRRTSRSKSRNASPRRCEFIWIDRGVRSCLFWRHHTYLLF